MRMERIIIMGLLMVTALVASPGDSWSSFEANWGNSDGDHQIARWLVNSGYYGEEEYKDAVNFARTGYTGHNSADADGYFWNASQPVTFEIMSEESAHADYSKLGFYTGSGDSKILSQVFGGLESGPKTLSINEPFGLYLGIWDNINWYTDRSENHEQSGSLKNMNGDAQGLIYELKPGQEWLIAWEDLDTTQLWADKDFNDMYVKVSYAPEPVSSTLFLLGAGAMAVSKMRRRSLPTASV